MSKLMSIESAISLIKDGDTIGIGGNVLNRAPMALVRTIISERKKELKLIKTAGAMDVDMLCLGECVYSVDAGFVSYESEFGLASHYRKAVQEGMVKGNEHACYTVISALRAASYGIPFMPVYGLMVGDLIAVNDYFRRIKDPFSDEFITIVKAIKPDVALIHVQEADEEGNAFISGPIFEDDLLVKAAKKVIVSAEKIVKTESFLEKKQKVSLPHFLVSAVVYAPKGASPCSCPEVYEIDREKIKAFKMLNNKVELLNYIANYKA